MDTDEPARSAANSPTKPVMDSASVEAEWDERYSGEQVWSGKPNASLVAEVCALPVGTALDVGAGEGGDALYLAECGWTVTANDISHRALDRINTAARGRGYFVTLLHADANGDDPFGGRQFDLVTAHYASIPRMVGLPAVATLLDAVAPDGTLLVVSHDFTDMPHTSPDHDSTPSHNPDDYVQVADVVDAIADQPGWVIDVFETRARPAGAASHHAADVIARAHRR